MAGEFLIKLSRTTDKPYFMKKSLGHRFRVHMHDFYEIELCLSGTGINRIDGIVNDFSPGICFLYFPHTIHELYNDNPVDNEFEILDIAFTSDFIHEDILRSVMDIDHPIKVELNSEVMRSCASLFAYYETISDNAPLCDMMFRSQLETLIVHILSAYGIEDQPRSNNNENRIQLVLRYIADNIAEVPTVYELSRIAGVSPSYFGEYFRTSVGMSFRDYFTAMRMKRAKHLVDNSPYSIREIACSCGFANESSFSHAFKAYFGTSASDIRNALNQ